MRQFSPHERHPRKSGCSLLRLTRVYVDVALTPGGVVELSPETASHLARVLRARVGDELILFNGDGREFHASIESVRGSRVAASAGEGRLVDRESPLAITLVQCVPRGDRMDFIVQKATELGVARIVPVLSQRSVVRLGPAQAAAKAIHWRGVAVSACEQCGRNRLPAIEPAQPLLTYLGAPALHDGLRLVFEPESGPGPHAAASLTAEIAIGPEGGFAEDELEAFRIAGFSRGGLGPRVLRTETAALAALVWLQTQFGDL